MPFIYLTFLAAFLLEGLGTWVSVIGLSSLFGANPVIMALAVTLDIGKIVVVSLLYNHWASMGRLMKTYALIASVITMIITSSGAAGYLIGEFQKAMLGTQETSLQVSVLKDQQSKYEDRKKQIDDQIANLPQNTSVNQRVRLIKQFKDEQATLQSKIDEIDKKLPDIQMKEISVNAKAGPILYVAKAFKVPVEEAIKYVVLLIVAVFDPLAIFLIVSGNFLMAKKNTLKAFVTKEDAKEEQALQQEVVDVAAPPQEEAPATITLADVKPIDPPELVQPATPGEAEAVSSEIPAVQGSTATHRDEIHIADLLKPSKQTVLLNSITPTQKPVPRSMLNDAPDAVVHFDNPPSEKLSSVYKHNS